MDTLYIDIETYSNTDLKTCGVYRYVKDPAFDVILIAYALNGEPVRVAESLTDGLARLLADPSVLKIAHNANFERICLSERYRNELPGLKDAPWRCSMVRATVAGYPASLKNAAEALRLPVGKMEEGKDLVALFSVPQRKADGTLYRAMPAAHPHEWETFREYCRRDVEVCRQVWQATAHADYPGLWAEYRTDAVINDRGIGLDTAFVRRAREFKEHIREEAEREFNRLTGVQNAKSGKQITQWLASLGIETDKVDKTATEAIAAKHGGIIEQAFRSRRELTKTSLAKYDRMADMEVNGRVYGMFQFYGAARTGRFAGRGIQPQNLPRCAMKDIDGERRAVLTETYEGWRMAHPDGADTLSQLLRTAFIAPKGKTFAVADYSAVEARVLAWLAGEKWRQEVFAGDGRIYEATAAKMFRVPAESITHDSPLRARGKVADLALGYQGAVNALKAMGALQMGIPEGELPRIVTGWRDACPNIVRFWEAVETAAATAIRRAGHTIRLTGNARGVSFRVVKYFLMNDPALEVALPSGRRLYYVNPSVELKQGRYRLTYMEEDGLSHRWIKTATYGGKLVENITQAICRDLLTGAQEALRMMGHRVVMHVHDEVVAEVDQETAAHEMNTMSRVMCAVPAWAEGLRLTTGGYISKYYKKD